MGYLTKARITVELIKVTLQASHLPQTLPESLGCWAGDTFILSLVEDAFSLSLVGVIYVAFSHFSVQLLLNCIILIYKWIPNGLSAHCSELSSMILLRWEIEVIQGYELGYGFQDWRVEKEQTCKYLESEDSLQKIITQVSWQLISKNIISLDLVMF